MTTFILLVFSDMFACGLVILGAFTKFRKTTEYLFI